MRAQRILVIDPFLPMHDRSSGSLRLNRILRMLVADGHEVTFVARDGWDPNGYADDLRALGVTVHAGDPQRLRDFGQEAAGNLDLEAIVRNGRFDTAVLCFYELATQYLPLVRRWSPSTRIVIDTVDIHFLRMERGAELNHDAVAASTAAMVKSVELSIYGQADALIAVSPDEHRTLSALVPGVDVFTITNVHPLPAPSPIGFAQRQGLLFVGNFAHTPNGEGILWFCEKVLPLVRQQLPAVPVDIVGQAPPQALAPYQAIGVRVHGWVPATEPYLMAARLSIAPLLHGAGQKGKVGEALSHGLPVVSTAIGAEGLGLTDDHDVLVADDPQSFADAIVRAYTDEHLWNAMAFNGRRLIAERFTPEACLADVRSLIPPSPSAPVRFFAAPDWSNPAALERALVDYCRLFDGATGSSFEIGIVDDAIDVQDAFAVLVDMLTRNGLDPEAIPNVGITPVDGAALSTLQPDTIWVPVSGRTRPEHLRADTFTLTAQ